MIKYILKLFAIIGLIWASFAAQSQSYDLEYLYYKDSVSQVDPTELINLTVKLEEEDISSIKYVHIGATNQTEGHIDQFNLKAEPSKGFFVSDSSTAEIVEDYLQKDLLYSTAVSSIRSHLGEPSLEVHPKMFVFEDDNQITLQFKGYPSNEAMFSFIVQLEDTTGISTSLDIDQITTLIK